jgi:SPP1 family predicted phage head-tail adaptor
MVRAGELDKQVLLQSRTVTRDGYGAEVEVWATRATVWAKVVPGVGREWFAAGQTQSEISHTVTIRYRKGVKPSDRLKYGDRIFDVKFVANHKEGNRELVLLCREFTT